MTDGLEHAREVTEADDLVGLREAAVTICSALGAPDVEGLRTVTSVTALAQDLLRAGGGRIDFACRPGGPLTVGFAPVALTVRQAEPGGWASSAPAVALLVDRVALGADGDPSTVTITASSPGDGPAPSVLADLSADLSRPGGGSGHDLLHEQTRDLLRVLAQEPSGGTPDRIADTDEDPASAIALYHSLSEELERTNLGVVALYAELDEKGRQLREASEAKTRFLRNISHELRSPANSIIGLTRLLLDEHAATSLDGEQQEQVHYIASSARDLLDLVNELLDLAAAESGRVDADPEAVPLSDVLADLRGTISPLLRPGVRLTVHPPPPDAEMRTDPTLLRHILRNLLSNAAKFTSEGEVELTVAVLEDLVRFEVQDTGIGISPEDQARIFEEFFQVRSPLHAGVKGTGLGLAFAQRIAVTLGGSVRVTSTPGVGSRFTVELPRDPSLAPVEKGRHL